MWHTSNGEHCFSGLFGCVLTNGLLRMSIQWLRFCQFGGKLKYGIDPFDQLTTEQQAVTLYELGQALFRPEVPSPRPAAYRDAAVAALFLQWQQEIETEIPLETNLSRCMFLGIHSLIYPNAEPETTEWGTNMKTWRRIIAEMEVFLLDHRNYDQSRLTDLPPEEMESHFRALEIPDDYFSAAPHDPQLLDAISLNGEVTMLCYRVMRESLSGYAVCGK